MPPIRSNRAAAAAVLTLTAALTLTLGCAAPARAQQYDPALFSGMRWRLVGPFRAGRSVAAAGVPGQPEHYYFGSVGGGVWESTNSGVTWKPIFDHEPIASIGAIAVAPSNPQIIYVGTGEADIRASNSYGDGMYRSDDGGRTWRHIGLDDSRRIARILVDPHDPGRVYVAALGHAYGANTERGVFRSTDGGRTWKRVLFRDANTGAIDLAFAPSQPDTIYASLWATRRPPWNVYPPSNGYGAVYRSTDGGDTWQRLTGLPGGPDVGRIGIAVAPSDPQRLYAQVDAKKGGIYRSDDAGTSWHLMDNEDRIWHRGWYFGSVTVDPKNPEVVYVMNTSVYRSTDGGRTFEGFKGAPGGDDYHQLWINPSDPQRMILASDQGVIVSVDGGGSWSTWNNQPTAQFYHVVVDDRFPFHIYGSQQDSGSRDVANRSSGFGGITFHDWTSACAGGESGYIAIDPLDPDILYGTSYDGSVTRCNQRTGERQNISPELAYPDSSFRVSWTMPLVTSPADPHALYFGDQYLFRTEDRGQSWRMISPDLTRTAPGVPPNLDPATARDQTAVERAGTRWGVIYTIAPSPLQADELWVGTDDGLVWITTNGGTSWSNVTPPALTPWSKVSMIEASHTNAAQAYVAIDRHRLDDFAPHIYRTSDRGRTWQEIDAGIPTGAYVNVIREDPVRPGLLFAGTELGAYVSFDDGDHWQSLQLNLPVSSIRDFAIRDNTLIAATHGRSFWALDDLAPLRQLTTQVAQANVHVFRPDTATLLRQRTRSVPASAAPYVDPVELAAGRNPPAGAAIDFYLKSPADSVALDVLDSAGTVVRHFSSSEKPRPVDPKSLDIPAGWIQTPEVLPASAGMHRWIWDLHEAQAGSAPAGFFGGGGPWALPGRYTVRLTVGGQSYSQPLVVRRDPRTHAPAGALAAQLEMARRIQAASQRAARGQREVGRLRSSIDTLRTRAAGHGPLLRALNDLDRKAKSIEGVQPPANPDAAGVGDGGPAPGTLMYLHGYLRRLQSSVEGGDLPPTAQTRTGFETVSRALDAALTRWDTLKSRDLPRLNTRLRRAGLPTISADHGRARPKNNP